MGSPVSVQIFSRIHTCTTVRGVSKTLTKVLNLACAELSYDFDFFTRIVERAMNIEKYQSPTWVSGDVYDFYGWRFKASHVGYTIIDRFLSAVTDAATTRRSVCITCSASYEWYGFDQYECVVIINFNQRK